MEYANRNTICGSVEETSIGYGMSTGNSNFKHNGRKRVKNKYAREEAKDASIMKVRVGDLNTVREKAMNDSVKNVVRKVRKKVTYADVVRRDKKGKE